MSPPGVLAAPLGEHLVLARRGGRQLFLLNPVSAWIWDARLAGMAEAEIAVALARRFAQPEGRLLTEVHELIGDWRRHGLLDPPQAPPDSLNLVPAPGGPLVESPGQPCRLQLGDQRVDLQVTDVTLAQALMPFIAHLRRPRGIATRRLALVGTAADWALLSDGVEGARGVGRDEALIQTISELVELGCNAAKRLLVVHGAGVVRQGRGVLLIGRGGSGKTTLAAALNAMGYGLLDDDVVPVTPKGKLVGLGMSLCLKSGSWNPLLPWRPDLEEFEVLRRYGQLVRFLPPRGRLPGKPVLASAFLFPRYDPNSTAQIAPLAPEGVLRGLIEAEPLLPRLTQERLERLTRWILSAPGWTLDYSTLEEGVRLFEAIVPQVISPP